MRSAPSSWPRTSCGRGAPSGSSLKKLADRPPLEPHRFRVGVYFADGRVNLYQLRQWYRPLVELATRHPVLILSRASGSALELLDESPLPVAYVRRVADLEQVIHEQDLHVVFYVNQNAKNFQMMRYGRRWHVFINHGESDKMYMTTNQFKAYDYALIAGDAARTRLEKVLWDYDFDKRAIPIGRPQADHYLDGSPLPYTPDDREVVLYAPTWEGDRGAAAYGSIASHGVALVRGLLATGRHRVIYRPHPRSGVRRSPLRCREPRDHRGHRRRERGGPVGAARLRRRPVARLAARGGGCRDRRHLGDGLRPPRRRQAAAHHPSREPRGARSTPAATCRRASGSTRRMPRRWSPASTRSPTTRRALARLGVWVERYFGDTTPGVTTARFHAAVDHLMAEWERFAALHAGDGEVDEFEEDDEDEAETLGA